MLFEKLSNHEKDLISRYIEAYGPNPEHTALQQSGRAPLDFVLRHWNHEKENLYHLLDDNLILEKHIEIEVDNTRIERNLEELSESNKLMHGLSYRTIFYSFWSWINHVSYHNWDHLTKQRANHWNEGVFREDYSTPVYEVQSSWFDFEHLAKNIYDGPNCVILLPDSDKPYQVKNGMRLTRLIDRLLKAYPETDFNSDKLNSLIDLIAIARTSTHSAFDLCLSIHPLDYMTMSDNDKNWTSCMAWKDHSGDYRQGTIECMNSPATLIAYIKEPNPMDLGIWGGMNSDSHWANKSWRQLFIVSEGAIVADKGYPFQYDAVVSIVLNWLQELAQKNWGIKYDVTGEISDNPGTVFNDKGDEIYTTSGDSIDLRVNWGYMYDDIGTLRRHRVVVNTAAINEYKKITHYSTYDIQGSGVSECMWCGGDIFGSEYCDDDETPSLVICDSCSTAEERWQCDECGEHYHRDELTYIPDLDVYLCDDCYNNKIFTDEFTGEMNWVDNMKEVYLALGFNKDEEIFVLKAPVCISDNCQYDQDIMEKYFKDPEHIVTYVTPVANLHRYRWEPVYTEFKNIVFTEDLTDAGLELFLAKANFENVEIACRWHELKPISTDFIEQLDRSTCSDPDRRIRLDDNDFTHHIW